MLLVALLILTLRKSKEWTACSRKYGKIGETSDMEWTKLNKEKFYYLQLGFTEYYWDDYLEENEMGTAYGTHGKENKTNGL